MADEGKTIVVVVNGEATSVPVGTVLANVLRLHGLDPDGLRGVAVALNDAVVRREAWGEASLSAGDRVEIVTAQQGG